MNPTVFNHMNHAELGWVRFHVANGTYTSSSIPNEIYHDLFEKNNLEWRTLMNDDMCKKSTKAGPCCKNKANTFTNGHWTCKKHASHVSIPTTNFVETKVTPTDSCELCNKSISNIETACISSCSHVFHKTCLLKYVASFPMYEECRFYCPTCRHELCLYGAHLIKNENSIPTFDEMLNEYADDSMNEFIDEYMKNNDLSFLIE